MRRTIKHKNIRKWASLSALGAGAVAFTGTAEADIVETNVNECVGFSSCSTTPIVVNLPGGARFSLVTKTFKDSVGTNHSVSFDGHPDVEVATYHLSYRGTNGVRAFSAGQDWNQVTRIETLKAVASGGHNSYSGTQSRNPFKSKTPYFLFSFQDSGKTLYGWGELSIQGNGKTGPDVTLVDYAYDDSGAKIEAGTTQLAPVPEPPEAFPLALVSLVMGAAGVRRWRKAKAA